MCQGHSGGLFRAVDRFRVRGDGSIRAWPSFPSWVKEQSILPELETRVPDGDGVS